MLSQRMGGSIAEALEDCTLCVISRHDLEHLIQSKPNFALNVVQLLALRTLSWRSGWSDRRSSPSTSDSQAC